MGCGEMSKSVTPGIAQVTRRPSPEITQSLRVASRPTAAAGGRATLGRVCGEEAGAEDTECLLPGAGV